MAGFPTHEIKIFYTFEKDFRESRLLLQMPLNFALPGLDKHMVCLNSCEFFHRMLASRKKTTKPDAMLLKQSLKTIGFLLVQFYTPYHWLAVDRFRVREGDRRK